MAILTKRRYTVAGDFSLCDEHGLVHHLTGGDELPANLQALLSDREIDLHLGTGMFREVGWRPPPRQTEAAPKPMTAAEVISGYGFPTAGPRCARLQRLDGQPKDKDRRSDRDERAARARRRDTGGVVMPRHKAPRYKALTSFSIGLASGDRVPVNTGDVLPAEWVELNQHQLDQMVASGNVVRLPDEPASERSR